MIDFLYQMMGYSRDAIDIIDTNETILSETDQTDPHPPHPDYHPPVPPVNPDNPEMYGNRTHLPVLSGTSVLKTVVSTRITTTSVYLILQIS